MGMLSALEHFNQDDMFEPSDISSQGLELAVESIVNEIEMNEALAEGETILAQDAAYEDAIDRLSKFKAAVEEFGLSKGMMQAFDPEGELTQIGFPSMESLDATPAFDNNATVVVESIKDTLKKWGENIKNFFIKIWKWLSGLFLKLKDYFTNYQTLLGNVDKAFKGVGNKTIDREKFDNTKVSAIKVKDIIKLAAATMASMDELKKFTEFKTIDGEKWIKLNEVSLDEAMKGRDLSMANYITPGIVLLSVKNTGGLKEYTTLINYLGQDFEEKTVGDIKELHYVSSTSKMLKAESGKSLQDLGVTIDGASIKTTLENAKTLVLQSVKFSNEIKKTAEEAKGFANRADTVSKINADENTIKAEKAKLKIAKICYTVELKIESFVIKAVKETVVNAAKIARAFIGCYK